MPGDARGGDRRGRCRSKPGAADVTILLDRRTAVIVHGAGGTVGTYQVKRMLSYGTKVVGLVRGC